jgi:hypothetical protein
MPELDQGTEDDDESGEMESEENEDEPLSQRPAQKNPELQRGMWTHAAALIMFCAHEDAGRYAIGLSLVCGR